MLLAPCFGVPEAARDIPGFRTLKVLCKLSNMAHMHLFSNRLLSFVSIFGGGRLQQLTTEAKETQHSTRCHKRNISLFGLKFSCSSAVCVTPSMKSGTDAFYQCFEPFQVWVQLWFVGRFEGL